jgi:nitrogen fixation NifU-like protein
MSELRELYQEVILDHGKNPRNFRAGSSGRVAHGHNPLCGDKIDVYLILDDNVVRDVSFTGSGCAISTASASMMTQVLKGKSLGEANSLFELFHDMVTGDDEEAARAAESLGKLAVFSGVREFPVRVKCATLAWHTFNAAAENKTPATAPSTTE